jgi:hypothetical protein
MNFNVFVAIAVVADSKEAAENIVACMLSKEIGTVIIGHTTEDIEEFDSVQSIAVNQRPWQDAVRRGEY